VRRRLWPVVFCVEHADAALSGFALILPGAIIVVRRHCRPDRA